MAQLRPTVRLENTAMGSSTFYVDGVDACNAGPGTSCLVTLHVNRLHNLSAYSTYSQIGGFTSREVTLQANANEAYRFRSCRETGAPGTSHGLFLVAGAPAEY